ncbi:MAG: hypothetical protein JOY82_14205 [Streptosporangiaceae bacterium]|nr:hypothetical protein [Streptosporangiaceae bacterium]MBV9855641.1 hypothetical protein [Streptosporangiaceae bacterium]
MTEHERAAEPGAAASPYLSMRLAVRPAIFAYRLLASDAERAGKLAAECEDLLLLTRELLKVAGQAQILSAAAAAEAGHEISHEHGGDRQSQLLGAYADAAMLWAKVVGSSVSLARPLLDRGDWDEVRRLARFLADAGETDAAADLRAQLGHAIWDTYRAQLPAISRKMPSEEIKRAIDALQAILRETPEDFPGRNARVNRFLPPLAASVHAIMKSKDTEIPYSSRVEHIAAGGVAKYPDIVQMSLDELSAEFDNACG